MVGVAKRLSADSGALVLVRVMLTVGTSLGVKLRGVVGVEVDCETDGATDGDTAREFAWAVWVSRIETAWYCR